MPLATPTAAAALQRLPCPCAHNRTCHTRKQSSLSAPHPGVPYTYNPTQHPFLPRPSRLQRKGKQQCRAAASPPAPVPADRKPRLALFVSGGGSNLRSIHAGILDGRINAEVAVVISDVPGCGGWEYAAAHGIPTEAYPAPAQPAVADSRALSTEALVVALREQYSVDYVLLAGYLKLIPAELVREYRRAMLNIHPALLPAFGGKGFYGGRVHRAVIASGARFSGPTIHFVDEGYDTGPILAQAAVPVSPTDTPQQLAARVLKEEHKLYPQAVAALVDGRVNWRADGIPVLWTAH